MRSFTSNKRTFIERKSRIALLNVVLGFNLLYLTYQYKTKKKSSTNFTATHSLTAAVTVSMQQEQSTISETIPFKQYLVWPS